MKITIHLAASDELVEAARFYTTRADRALGAAFIDEFERALSLLSANPELGAIWRGSARRYPLRRFPYYVVYQLKAEELRVIALAHQRKRPYYWKSRG